ncbi:lipoyl(octanoyl) transferase LipB [Buchnera aphidicola (Mindarus keteleerifoliae)]|uniref:lipoyl(octanoyl) transferase LipB n=1 Tax=Buchnera aphidicola TaxID=9 RepID=UPI0031B6C8B0
MYNQKIIIRDLGLKNWKSIVDSMFEFNSLRKKSTLDEVWLVEHYSIYTQGQIKNKKNIINVIDIPVANSDRGGQITYHGPGQKLMYFLIDLKRRKIHVRHLIEILQKIILNTLNIFNIFGNIKNNMPGVFIKNKKVCSLGLKIQNGCSLYGLSLNVNMDLSPFRNIIPCGNKTIKMTNIVNYTSNKKLKNITNLLKKNIIKEFKNINN